MILCCNTTFTLFVIKCLKDNILLLFSSLKELYLGTLDRLFVNFLRPVVSTSINILYLVVVWEYENAKDGKCDFFYQIRYQIVIFRTQKSRITKLDMSESQCVVLRIIYFTTSFCQIIFSIFLSGCHYILIKDCVLSNYTRLQSDTPTRLETLEWEVI